MHLPDGILQASIAQGTQFLGALALAYSIRRSFAEDIKGDLWSTVRMVAAATGVFALQAVITPGNAPITPHFLGAFGVCLMLGPGTAGVIAATVILFQTMGLGDGSIPTLGANYLAMGIIPIYTGLLLYDFIRQLDKGRYWSAVSAGLAATASIVFASGFVGLITAMDKPGTIAEGLRTMVVGNSWTALLEGIATGILFLLLSARYPKAIQSRFKAD